ncbi:MAG: sugar ABC transporter permease [Pseudomonadota bacterium]
MLPALIGVVLFYLLPVVMTGFFAFTNMSTSTGIRGGEYLLTPGDLRDMPQKGVPEATVSALADAGYVVDARGLAALGEAYGEDVAEEFGRLHGGEHFARARDIERALRNLPDHGIRRTRERKAAADLFRRSVLNERYPTEAAFRGALTEAEIAPAEQEILVKEAWTGWSWTTDNFKLLFTLPSTLRYALNSVFYVAVTLIVFNVGMGLFLAIATFYLPQRTATTFRAIWFLPRILPPVLYVLMWKWLMWDDGFISSLTGFFGMAPKNWMMDSAAHAWVAIILINGVVGASFGMILFASAITAIPKTMLYASEVDGASRWQQVRYIILPQLKWPILFVTAYQSLSLLASFEYILLATEGGPGSATEVWALAAFQIALSNYGGNLQYGLGAAFALILVIIGTVLSLSYLRFFNFGALVGKPRIER